MTRYAIYDFDLGEFATTTTYLTEREAIDDGCGLNNCIIVQFDDGSGDDYSEGEEDAS